MSEFENLNFTRDPDGFFKCGSCPKSFFSKAIFQHHVENENHLIKTEQEDTCKSTLEYQGLKCITSLPNTKQTGLRLSLQLENLTPGLQTDAMSKEPSQELQKCLKLEENGQGTPPSSNAAIWSEINTEHTFINCCLHRVLNLGPLAL